MSIRNIGDGRLASSLVVLVLVRLWCAYQLQCMRADAYKKEYAGKTGETDEFSSSKGVSKTLSPLPCIRHGFAFKSQS